MGLRVFWFYMYTAFMRKNLLFLVFLILFIPNISSAQHGYQEEIYKAKVLEILEVYENPEPLLYDESTVQVMSVRILNKSRAGEIIEFNNDYIKLKEGQRFFLGVQSFDDENIFRVVERDRSIQMLFFGLLFVLTIILFGRMQGVRSVISLLGSILIITYILIPSILGGASPIVVSLIVATLILSVAIFFTHGFKRESLSAFMGTIISVIITILLSLIAVRLLGFSGLGTDETWYLKDMVDGINFSGLLLGGIILGVLGVLDDIAVTQVAVVRELYYIDPLIKRSVLYKKALRVGQEHVGALVNTLALAYAGAGLPLLMLFAISPYPIEVLMSQEIFAAEFIRTIVGSIGLVLTVPITTGIAVYMLEKYRGQKNKNFGHTH